MPRGLSNSDDLQEVSSEAWCGRMAFSFYFAVTFDSPILNLQLFCWCKKQMRSCLGPNAKCLDSTEVKSQLPTARKVSGGNQEMHVEALCWVG